MFDNFKAKRKLGVLTFNYKEDKVVTWIFNKICEEHWDSVDNDGYHITVKAEGMLITFWSANRYYGYASDGTAVINGQEYPWIGARPSAVAMLKMVRRVNSFILEKIQ